MNTLSFSMPDLKKLEYIKEGNRLPNLHKFIQEVLKTNRINDLFKLWVFTNSQIDQSIEYSTFLHELGAVLIHCKLYPNSFIFGTKYGSLAVTTYQNNSIPNLIEISVVWPSYANSPIKELN